MNKEILMVVDAVSNEKGVSKEIIFEDLGFILVGWGGLGAPGGSGDLLVVSGALRVYLPSGTPPSVPLRSFTRCMQT